MRTLAALVFPGFETLDYFGPMEMLGGFGNETECPSSEFFGMLRRFRNGGSGSVSV